MFRFVLCPQGGRISSFLQEAHITKNLLLVTGLIVDKNIVIAAAQQGHHFEACCKSF